MIYDIDDRPDCSGTMIEHVTGAAECSRLGQQCFADWHEGGLVVCEEVYGHEHVCPAEPRVSQRPSAAVTWSLPHAGR